MWTVSTKPYKGAHFATFPPDLILPAILAGTSEQGCCPECGAPWERILEKQRVATRTGENSKVKVPSGWDTEPGGHGTVHRTGRRSAAEVGNRDPERHVTRTATVGWKPTCNCGRPSSDNVPCTVLDPFGGSGTTAEVAIRSNCCAIVSELNPEYVSLIKQRLADLSLMIPGGIT